MKHFSPIFPSIMERRSKRKKSTSKDHEAVQAQKVESSAKQGERQTVKEEFGRRKSCKYVVAIDFGTTFSGVAFAKYADLQSTSAYRSDAIDVHTNWPGQGEAGAKAYCKTQTSAWYMPGQKPGTFELKGWGWTGYLDYRDLLQNTGMNVNCEIPQSHTLEPHKDNHDSIKSISSPRVSARCLSRRPQKYGHFLERFKLGLVHKAQDLPEGLSLERVISDYLRELSTYILKELRKRYGSEAGLHREVQYVLTVPAMWTDREKQTMKECAEMAGMVGGPACKDNTVASVHELIIQREPDAAAVHVHKTLQTIPFANGARFLVVDVGGGTTDIVLHEKIGSTTRGNIRVKEIAVSLGELVGGIHVDEQFYNYLRNIIGRFMEFEKNYPRDILEINRWWNDIKYSFDGCSRRFTLPIPNKLAKSWKQFDRSIGQERPTGYRHLQIDSSDIQSIFDPVVNKILTLIRQRVVPGLKAILVVGGFSESPYLSKRIQEAFEENTIFVPNGGSAIVRGAVSYAAEEWRGMVTSRKSSTTIGYDTSKLFISGKHRHDYKVIDQIDPKHPAMCDNIFKVIIRKGQEVLYNHTHSETFKPLYREGKNDDDEIELNLYQTRAKNPRYVTDKGVKKLATCHIRVPRKESLGREPKLQLSMYCDKLLQVTVEGQNFEGEKVTLPSVQMKWVPLNA